MLTYKMYVYSSFGIVYMTEDRDTAMRRSLRGIVEEVEVDEAFVAEWVRITHEYDELQIKLQELYNK